MSRNASRADYAPLIAADLALAAGGRNLQVADSELGNSELGVSELGISELGISELGANSLFDDAGLPGDRAARIAARRAFVAMKQLFIRAAAPLQDRKGEWLRSQVRQAEDPIDLWLLRGPLLASLRQNDDDGNRRLRAELYRELDNTFPDTFGLVPGGSLPEPWQTTSTEVLVPGLPR